MNRGILKYMLMMGCLSIAISSCIRQLDLSIPNKPVTEEDIYIYPYSDERQNVTAEITIHTNAPVNIDKNCIKIPHLKYNKSWLFILTQDDCKHSTFCYTWAAINGKPLSNDYFYDVQHLRKGDLPPDFYYLGKTLGSTDGTGNEVRFAFTATLYPQWEKMKAKAVVNPGYTKNYYRFYEESCLSWSNVKEMTNYGVGIAFHNLIVDNENDKIMILQQFPIAQDSVLKHLNGRGCKMLAEPDGNKAYVNAALEYVPIQTMTAQSGTVKLYPFKVEDDLHNTLIERWFNDSPEHFRSMIEVQLSKPKEERKAICVGVHGTDTNWVKFFEWINDNYGKDGDDSVWFPSQEEYYEYNYYRIHGDTKVELVDEHTVKFTVHLPSAEYFYYPSVTVNLKGLKMENIASVETDNTVSGLSYADFEDGIMMNIDCRKHLAEHATHFVEQYERDKSNASNKADALYFVRMLKDSEQKRKLLDRIQ